MSRKLQTLAQYVDNLQSKGFYVFNSLDAALQLNITKTALKFALQRLKRKKRICRLRNTLYLIIPIEYKTMGAPPPSWFIHQLMQHHQQPYYVGLLSAAALFSATHQQPQVFQVITNKTLRDVVVGRARIQFFTNSLIEKIPIQEIKTQTGFMTVSTPEITALDLVRYSQHAGYLSNVATILTELVEKIEPSKLRLAAQVGYETAVIQRLGFILDEFSEYNLTQPLHSWLVTKKIRMTPLAKGKSTRNAKKNKKWLITINETIEVDL